MKRVWLVVLAACGTPSESDGPDAGANADASVDAGPTAHVGGWRMRAGDASRAHRGATAGPSPAAVKATFYQHPSTEEHAGLGSPIVDEKGNLYLVEYTPMQPSRIVSLPAAGSVRWKGNVEQGWSIYDLSLGADGHLYGVATRGSGATAEAKMVSWDSSTGASRPGSAPIAGLSGLLLPPDGSIYTLMYSQATGYGLEARTGMTGAPRWTKSFGGDAYALSPAGDTLVVITVPMTAGSAHEAVALDPATGAEKWRYTIDATLITSPTLAIDVDGRTYLAMSKSGRDLTIMRLSPTGALEWTHVEPYLTYPSRILLGKHDTVAIAAQTQNYYGAGVVLTKGTGNWPPNTTLPCGEPQAIDSNDVLYWGCEGGIQATTQNGTIVQGWEGRDTFSIVLGPSGALYHVPAAYFADHQLFRIQ
jgi:outer membrane protein assembly factor BamB